jgi:hypothetical protein
VRYLTLLLVVMVVSTESIEANLDEEAAAVVAAAHLLVVARIEKVQEVVHKLQGERLLRLPCKQSPV